MNSNEKRLFKILCNFNTDIPIKKELLKCASPEVLGQLFSNRMQGAALVSLEKNPNAAAVGREFLSSLKRAREAAAVQNRSFYRGVGYISLALKKSGAKYAMLKGALLCGRYPDGCRTSNDVDILVLPEDVTAVGKALSNAGFSQGKVKNGVFIPATRREITESKMLRGETVPYIMEVNLPFMKFLEADLNFSTDFKNGDGNDVKKLLENADAVSVEDTVFKTLAPEDFFIHLCMHLYKEATTLPWIEMRRDMTLYKYCDIYLLLSEMCKNDIDRVFKRAKEFGAEKICAFSILSAAALFAVEGYAVNIADEILKGDPEFMNRVFDPAKNKTLIYGEKDIGKRFFTKDRLSLLEEI